jgi:hypothetical protein
MSTIRKRSVDLFTPDEHAVLSKWFGVKPPECAKGISPPEAAKRLGFEKTADYRSSIDAAAAFVVLERVEARLPQWTGASDTADVLLARKYRDRGSIPDRTVLLQPRHLFTINWANNGAGYSRPVAYYLTWVPYYDRYVVTASADGPRAFGYCDFALGHFGIKTSITEGVKEIICTDWLNQKLDSEQRRWAYLFDTDLISAVDARMWADEVWPAERAAREAAIRRAYADMAMTAAMFLDEK